MTDSVDLVGVVVITVVEGRARTLVNVLVFLGRVMSIGLSCFSVLLTKEVEVVACVWRQHLLRLRGPLASSEVVFYFLVDIKSAHNLAPRSCLLEVLHQECKSSVFDRATVL